MGACSCVSNNPQKDVTEPKPTPVKINMKFPKPDLSEKEQVDSLAEF